MMRRVERGYDGREECSLGHRGWRIDLCHDLVARGLLAVLVAVLAEQVVLVVSLVHLEASTRKARLHG